MRRRDLLLCAFAIPMACAACQDNLTHPPSTATASEGGTTSPLSCVPNLDGVIESSEAQPTLGIAAHYLINPSSTSRTVDVVGSTDSTGQLVWDWGTSYSNDEDVAIEAEPVQGKWYAATFPNGQFATAFDAAHTLEAVYSQDDDGLYLQGLASTDENPSEGQTLWAYDTPVRLYAFPLSPGTTWSATGNIEKGLVKGLPYSASDTYQGTDDATGQLVLPDFTFTQAHRLRFVVTTTFSAGGAPQVNRQVSFLFECFGEVGRATSQANETNDDFTTAVEQRRLSGR